MGTGPTGPTASAPASSATRWASTTPTATAPSTTHSPVWARTFSRNVRLVDPHGNFGTLDDPPAAYRYTECRLSPAAIELLAEIDEDTVEFRPTFDGERSEPIYLPARLPNLLVNGTSGIAVGMATNMPPHNLVEVYEAIKLVMTKRRPKPTIDELMAVLPGPDLPSGGIIIDDGLADAYATGRGTFRMRATAEIVNLTRSRQGIVVTELPYMVGPERVVARIQELVNNGKLAGVADVKNLQDRRTGMNITIELKPGVNAKAVLTELYRLTPMEETFGVNNVVLVERRPHHRRHLGPLQPTTPSTASTWYAAAPSTASAGPATGCTSSTAC
jgi:DNA gyrase subunit A